MQVIQSAQSELLTSAGLAAFKISLANAELQSAAIERDLAKLRPLAAREERRYRWWADGWLFRKVLKAQFAKVQAKSEASSAEIAELEEQLKQSRLHTEFKMPADVSKAYEQLRESFSACARAERIWDNVAQRATNRTVERTSASGVVDLKPVKFTTGQCGSIRAPMDVPCLKNANGGDLYLYPGFVVYDVSAANLAFIEFSDVDLVCSRLSFQEQAAIPNDAVQIGVTWDKTNKDGSPDKRFSGNFQIPVLQYARITLKSPAGLNEEYVVSNVAAAEAFAADWKTFKTAQRDSAS